MSVFVQLVGVTAIVAVLVDVWVTILHPDAEGWLAASVRRAVWLGASKLATRRRIRNRTALVLAGPLLVTATFGGWITLLVLGVALVVWPSLGDYRTTDGFGTLGFADALYYAGGTLTVLGYGDITPATTALKMLSVVVSTIGFAFFTALVTYVIELIAGLSVRNRFALAVHDQAQDADGADLMIRCLATEGPAGAAERCRIWADMLHAVEETVRRYPLVALTYRPARPEYDLEPALERLTGATVAAVLVAGCPAWHTVALRADELARALLRVQDTISRTYLRRHASADGPELDEEVTRMLAELDQRLAAQLGDRYQPAEADSVHARHVLAPTIRFLRALEGWAAPAVAVRRPGA